MNILLTTLNAKYIHKNLALRYLFVTKPEEIACEIKEYTIKDDVHRIVDELLQRNDDVIAFSTYIWNVEQTSDIVRLLKQKDPSKIIVLGGPEVSFDAPHFIETLGVDAVVCGEGEFVFWDYINSLRISNSNLTDIDGVYTKDNIPSVKYAMVDLEKLELYPKPYFLNIDTADLGKRYFYMETSRGCPYRCAYCLSSVQGKVRMFSQEYVLGVLDQVFARPIRQIKFLDRTFNVDKNRALLFASYISDHAQVNQIFQFEIMAEYVSDELINYLKQKSKYPQFRFEIGIQSTNQKSLHEIDRVQNFDRLRHVIHELQESGYHELHVDLIAGLPFEDLASFRKSFNDVFSLQASELQLGFLKLLRGTRLRRQVNEYEMKFEAKAPYEVSRTKWMSENDMNEIHEVCYALDVLYNLPRAKQTIQTILANHEITPYDLFHLIGTSLYQKRFTQLDELFRRVSEALREMFDRKLVIGLLANDYYALFKQRPKRFHDEEIPKQIKQQVIEVLQTHHTVNELIHYGVVDYGYYEKDGIGYCGYQFILYNNKQTYPIRYIIDQSIKEATLVALGGTKS